MFDLPNSKRSLVAGFTLVEILIVVTIIGILVSVVLPRTNSARDKARIAGVQVELDGIKTSLSLLHNDTGYYPNGVSSYCRSVIPAGNEVDLSSDNASLVANGLSLDGWSGPYIGDVEDPWGNPYYLDEDYQCMASTTGCKGIVDIGNDSSVIVSCGPNGAIADGSCAYDTDNIVYRLCD